MVRVIMRLCMGRGASVLYLPKLAFHVCAYEMFTSKFDVETKINTTVQLLFLWSDGLLIFVIQIGNGDSIKF